MRVELTRDFERAFRKLSASKRSAVERALGGLPAILGDPHGHRGLGVRKLHASGIWEARVGLGLRMVFSFRDEVLTLRRLGSHDDVQRFLARLR